MAGTTHPFFGNQYTDGGYIIGSFKFPEGLPREVGKQIAKITVPDTVPSNIGTISSACNSTPLESVVKTGLKNKWIIPGLIIATIAASSSYFAYRHFKKKEVVKIPNVGICEYCGEPLTEAKLILNNSKPYIICRKCERKNFAKYPNNKNSENPN